jgi:UDP-galactopyranose mutase
MAELGIGNSQLQVSNTDAYSSGFAVKNSKEKYLAGTLGEHIGRRNEMNMKKIVIVGSGFSGSVIARKLAEDLNRPVLVLEKRRHIAGNMFDEINEHGVLMQRYGPHIVCTNKWEIIEYLGRYSEMFSHTVKLLSFIDGNYVRLPFNFESIQQFLGGEQSEKLINDLRKEFRGHDRIPVLELVKSSNSSIAKFGNFLFEKSYRNYCAKQWDIPLNSIDKTVMDRVPMVIGYDERYMNKDFQYLPKKGFTELFKNLLNHSNIFVSLNTDALKHIMLDNVNKRVLFDGEEIAALIFTGPIDELLGLKYGALPYRSLDIRYDWFDKKRELPSEIVSYPQADGYTRRTEYKYLMYDNAVAVGTTIATEFPCAYNAGGGGGNLEPFYPVLTEENRIKYESYRKEIETYRNIFLCGRLAEFKYYNMDDCILRAFCVFEKIKSFLKTLEGGVS